jgi:hypothetical protein
LFKSFKVDWTMTVNDHTTMLIRCRWHVTIVEEFIPNSLSVPGVWSILVMWRRLAVRTISAQHRSRDQGSLRVTTWSRAANGEVSWRPRSFPQLPFSVDNSFLLCQLVSFVKSGNASESLVQQSLQVLSTDCPVRVLF